MSREELSEELEKARLAHRAALDRLESAAALSRDLAGTPDSTTALLRANDEFFFANRRYRAALIAYTEYIAREIEERSRGKI
jgi:hypothetical protein